MLEERVLTEFADLLENTTGLATSESNRSHLKRVILRESQARAVTPEELLTQCTARRGTLQKVIDAAMIGETYFFREVAQFRYLREVIAPTLLRRGTPITVWSASCSTGEEAISLAVLLHDAARRGGVGSAPAQSGAATRGDAPGSDSVRERPQPLRVYAGDIRSDVVARIARGEYPRSALRRDGAEYHELFLSRYVTEERERTIIVSPEILELIDAHTINLFVDPLDVVPDDLDVVFFRNTLIYAPAVNRDLIIRRIVTKIKPGGYLFLASSELPFVTDPELELVDGGGLYCLRKAVVTAPLSPPTPVPGDAIAPAGVSPPGDAGEVHRRWSIRDVVSAISGDASAIQPELVETARIVAALFRELDEDRFDHVDQYLTDLDETGADDTVIDYCTAWSAYSRGNTEAATRAFGDAIAWDDRLWPAYFYRGRLREKTDLGAAREDFAACVRRIDQSSSDSFRFLVGGFDSRQIRELCLRSIERIDAERIGTSHGS